MAIPRRLENLDELAGDLESVERRHVGRLEDPRFTLKSVLRRQSGASSSQARTPGAHDRALE
jgi:hypothetical protein